MTDYFKQGKEWLSKQSELKEKEKILVQRAKEHDEINEEKERLLREQRLARVAGSMSDEDRRLLETRHERLEKKAQENKAKLASVWKGIGKVFGTVDKYTGSSTRSRRKKRLRY